MIYYLVRILARVAVRIYFKKIHIVGLERIPDTEPLFIASNHPNGFMEAILIACFIPRPLYFLVRGDVFAIRSIKPLLIATNQIPIYRSRDGFSNLRNNAHTLSSVNTYLKEKKVILIFPEGTTQWVIRLRPLQKGMARMIFSVMEQNPEIQPQIVPVGVNFTNPSQFRSEVMIKVGEPLKSVEYLNSYLQNQRKAITDLTDETHRRMKECVLHIEEENTKKILEKAEIYRSQWKTSFLPFVERSGDRLEFEKKCADSIQKVGWNLEKNNNDYTPVNRNMVDYALFIPAIIGYILWFIPFFIIKKITDRLAKGSIFYGSIMLTGGAFITLIYFVIVAIAIIAKGGWSYSLFIVIPVAGLAYLYLRHRDEERKKSLIFDQNRNWIQEESCIGD